MKKAEQMKMNDIAKFAFNEVMHEFFNTDNVVAKRLRTCSAWVYETEHYYILKSYNTYIACIIKATDTLIDVLREEYGYTSTSAQHIAKFDHDYGSGKWGVANRVTWRRVE